MATAPPMRSHEPPPPLTALPPEVLQGIVGHLGDHVAVCRVARTCRALARAASANAVWRGLCRDVLGIRFHPPGVDWRRCFIATFRGAAPPICLHLNAVADADAAAAARMLADTLAGCTAPGGDARVSCSVAGCGVLTDFVWVCLDGGCGFIGCGRTSNMHAREHSLQTGHFISFKVRTLEAWCYTCSQWLGIEERHEVERRRVAQISDMIRAAAHHHRALDSDIENERRRFQRSLPMLASSDRIYFVSAKWSRAWQDYLVGNGRAPGPIDNSGLLVTMREVAELAVHGSEIVEPGTANRLGLMLKREIDLGRPLPLLDHPILRVGAGVQEDFLYMGEPMWDALVDLYGGGPPICEDELDPELHRFHIESISSFRRRLVLFEHEAVALAAAADGRPAPAQPPPHESASDEEFHDEENDVQGEAPPTPPWTVVPDPPEPSLLPADNDDEPDSASAAEQAAAPTTARRSATQ
ncbi:hypothetical protein HK105_200774 [Polyrhizophydium stewartii]|uniref:Ubiquitinyl hydrolase 1 n=1 Tax=Polyrhizophydium stewartii TaxID=2732419 RepID=A0ABR4NK16_9FUNG|nr:hypothetical protein HK105_005176 [Polyrhizophydium stewartii]